MKVKNTIIALIVFVFIVSCKDNKEAATDSLKNKFKKNFYIGTALSEDQIEEKDPKVTALIAKEFNSITAENIMKSMFVHPEKDRFDFKMTDKFIVFGKKHQMYIHGHTLIWHSQLPPWMTEIKDSVTMATTFDHHITTIVKRYKGKIDSWDVVNEALNEDGSLRKSVFLETYGEEFLTLAFKLAEKADSKADLYYNDYNICNPEKRAGVVTLVKNLKKAGAKIDGIGIQGHWSLTSPSIQTIEETIETYAALGVKVAFTELDINVLPSPWELVGAEVSQKFENSPKMNPYPKSLPDSIQTKLANRYADIFKLFLKHQDKISRVTFWGVNDGQSWLNDWPIKGRTNYPLLFDREFKAKKAYKSVMSLQNQPTK